MSPKSSQKRKRSGTIGSASSPARRPRYQPRPSSPIRTLEGAEARLLNAREDENELECSSVDFTSELEMNEAFLNERFSSTPDESSESESSEDESELGDDTDDSTDQDDAVGTENEDGNPVEKLAVAPTDRMRKTLVGILSGTRTVPQSWNMSKILTVLTHYRDDSRLCTAYD
ncbi:hypothetical protein MMC07_008904 [Pseudocyphellaria aurata]|nr:hypothetical protein [Pseudocyphellaria aurata]